MEYYMLVKIRIRETHTKVDPSSVGDGKLRISKKRQLRNVGLEEIL